MPENEGPPTPDAGAHFHEAAEPTIEPTREEAASSRDREDELDHLDLATFDYTPGGALEYDVHKQLSESGRRQYQERMRQTEPSAEKFYDDQLDRQFNEASREDRDPDEPEPEPSDPDGNPRGPDRGSSADFERASRFDREDDREPER